jgi:hypothetical protein
LQLLVLEAVLVALDSKSFKVLSALSFELSYQKVVKLILPFVPEGCNISPFAIAQFSKF